MISTFGTTLLALGALAAWLAFALSIPKKSRSLARPLLVLSFLAYLLASVLLYSAIFAGDYSLRYVQKVVSDDLPLIYKISAFWGGQGGSLLLWLLILSGYASWTLRDKGAHRAHSTMALILALFSVLIFFSDPFAPAPPQPGRGLNPLLRNIWMAIHPPAVYLGYVGSAVPLAYLLAGKDYTKKARLWALFSWTMLGFGIFTGGRWAYVELGWGGYWAWDPVENASLAPWLFGTALVHSLVVRARRWALLSAFGFFLVSVIGTFITRSGVIESVHAFAKSPIAYGFYFLFAAITLWFIWAIRSAWPPKSEAASTRAKMVSYLNLVSWALGLLIIIITLVKPKTSPETYDAITAPLWALWLVVGSLAMLSPPKLKKLLLSGIFALLALPLLWWAGLRHPYGLFGGMVAGFTLGSALTILPRYRSPRSLGVLLSHLGLGLVALGIVASKAEVQAEAEMVPGESTAVAGYTFTLKGINESHREGKLIREAVLETPLGRLAPTATVYPGWEMMGVFPDADIIPSIRGDLYAAYYGTERGKAGLLLAFVPLIYILWAGGFVVFAGGLLAWLGLWRWGS